MSIASDIGIFTNAPERIVVGNIALSALLEAMDAAEPYSNTWDQADSSHVHTELLVFLNGRWRIAFPE